ncbi:Jade-3, partial, partial [Paramuricea clavata]
VPVNKESLPQPSFTISNSEKSFQTEFRMPYKLVNYGKKKENMAQKSPLYDLDDEDVEWLKALNKSRKNQDLEVVEELLMEKAIGCLEDQCYTNMGETISTAKGLSIEYDEDIVCDICRSCYTNMGETISTAKGLSIEYDEDIVCDICRSPECEDGNEILFCDVCDVAVHQACYGVQKVPIGSWVCKPCTQLLSDCPCLLCSTRGGAMKKTKTKGVEGWVHMSCALWIPEVGIGNVEKMEPITRIETIT